MGKLTMPGLPGEDITRLEEHEAVELIKLPAHERPAHLSWLREEAHKHQAADPAVRKLLAEIYRAGFTRGKATR